MNFAALFVQIGINLHCSLVSRLGVGDANVAPFVVDCKSSGLPLHEGLVLSFGMCHTIVNDGGLFLFHCVLVSTASSGFHVAAYLLHSVLDSDIHR